MPRSTCELVVDQSAADAAPLMVPVHTDAVDEPVADGLHLEAEYRLKNRMRRHFVGE